MRGLNQSHIDAKLTTVRFIIDLFNNSKLLQIDSKQAFFSQLVKPELLSLLTEIMTYKEGPVPTFVPVIKGAAVMGKIREEIVKLTVEEIVDAVVARVEKKETGLKIEGEEGIHAEFEIGKLELLKVHVAEILTGCLQILPSKVMFVDSS